MKTPLHSRHIAEGGKIVDFHGWELPVQYSGIIAEHKMVRQSAGIFDVSHMGEIVVEGKNSLQFLDNLVTNSLEGMQDGKVVYTPMCSDDGGCVDDLLIYKINDEKFFLVVNASNSNKDYDWICKNLIEGVSVKNVSEFIAQLAVQGKNAEKILQKLIDKDLGKIKSFTFLCDIDIANVPTLISRTGYTGEDGFEIYMHAEDACTVWDAVLTAGGDEICPIGLGARDTLRFEACLPLYGNELSAEISPIEAGLKRFIRFEKDSFIGKQALEKKKEDSDGRISTGLHLIDKGIARGGCSVYIDGELAGIVTSGSTAPWLEGSYALALIKKRLLKEGAKIEIEVRGKRLNAEQSAIPFYKRK